MSNFLGTFTVTSTGLKSITGFGFNPNDLDFTVRAKSGAASQLNVIVGSVDSAGNQGMVLNYYGPTSYTSNSASDKVIWIREHSGGTWVDVLVASFDSYITDGFKLNVTSYSGGSNYIIGVKARLT